MLKLSGWLLRVALKVRIRALEATLAHHVQFCTGRGRIIGVRRRSGGTKYKWAGSCTRDLENCDASQFCPVGRELFNASFDLNEVLYG